MKHRQKDIFEKHSNFVLDIPKNVNQYKLRSQNFLLFEWSFIMHVLQGKKIKLRIILWD